MNAKTLQTTDTRRFGWLPDLPDHRDLRFTVQRRQVTKVPDVMDLRKGHTPVEDQGSLGSCTANAIVGMMEFLDNRDGMYTDLSRLFLYYYERERIGTVSQDSGACLRDGIKVLLKKGICPETMWPYDVAKFKKRPTKACQIDALKRTIKVYRRIETIDEMLVCLSQGTPFVGGITVYDSFMSATVARTGVVPMPKITESVQGGHALEFCGAYVSKKLMIGRNSWGKWGMNGYFTIPFAYLANRSLSDDFWCVER